MTPVISILIVEDQQATAAWLERLMGDHFPTANRVVRHDLAGAMRWLSENDDPAPLCLVDIGLPDGSGIEFVRTLMRQRPAARPIVTTLFTDDTAVLQAMAAGATGYLLKDQEPETIGARIAAIERGEVPMSPVISRRILEHFRADARFHLAASDVALTPREVEVLRLIGRGLRVAEVANTLGVSAQTVPGYLKTIYRKLDISSRAEAALEALRRGLV